MNIVTSSFSADRMLISPSLHDGVVEEVIVDQECRVLINCDRMQWKLHASQGGAPLFWCSGFVTGSIISNVFALSSVDELKTRVLLHAQAELERDWRMFCPGHVALIATVNYLSEWAVLVKNLSSITLELCKDDE